MCLIAKHASAKIASDDIAIFKVLRKYGRVYKSPWWGTEWKLGEIKTSPMKRRLREFTKGWQKKMINQGLHAYLATPKRKRSTMMKFTHSVVFAGIVPKGSYYYLGEDNEIVANQMIMTKKTRRK